MSILQKSIAIFSIGCAIIAGVIIVAIALLGTADVLGYHAFQSGVPGALALSSKGLAAAFFLALPLAQYRAAHVSVDIVANLMPRSVQRACSVIALLGACIVFGVIAWQAVELVAKSYRFSESAQGILPFAVWPFKVTVLIGAIGSVVIALARLCQRENI